MTTVDDLTLVPPGRLAALLSATRRASGLDVVALSQRSAGVFSPQQLRDIEMGRVALPDTEVEQVAALYEVESAPIVPERSTLIVDLNAGKMTIADSDVSVGTGQGSIDEVLERYVSLLYILRGLEPGAELTLRDRDLVVLSETLEEELANLERRLAQLMVGVAVEERTRLLGGRFAIQAAGLLVAVTTVGSLIIVGAGTSPEAATETFGQFAKITAPAGLISPVLSATGSPLPSVTASVPDSEKVLGTFALAIAEEVEVVETAPRGTAPIAVADELAAGQMVPGELIPVEPVGTFSAAIESAPVSVAPATLATPSLTTYEQRGVEAEALIVYDFRSVLPGWTIDYQGATPGYRGLTHTPTQSITIYVTESDSQRDIAGVLAHEIGHAIDVVYLNDETRTQWLTAREMPRAWWPGNGLGDFNVGAGDFSEGVAAYLVGSPSDSVYGSFTAEQLALIGDLLP